MKIHGMGYGVVVGLCVAGTLPPWQAVAQANGQAAGQSADATAELYHIHPDRDMVVGDAYRWSSNEYERTTVTRGEGDDAEVESDTYLKYGILANSRVDAVDEASHTLATTHIIERLYLMEEELLEPGTVVVATRGDGETIYTIGDDRIENETMLYVLDKLAELHDDEPDDLESWLRLPEEPQPVGANWEIDGPAFFGSALDLEEPLDELQASGEIHLAAVEDVFGEPGLLLRMQFLLDGVLEPFAVLRPDCELLSATILVEGEVRIPQELGQIEGGLEMTNRFTQQWRDPDADEPELSVVIYSEVSVGQRELTDRERELLGFE